MQIRGDVIAADFGSQIRNYVLAPYKMVKCTRSGHETTNTQAVLDGDAVALRGFMDAYLRWSADAAAADLRED